MKKILFAILMLPMFALGQATTGFHRVAQVIARAPLNSVTAQVVPYATIVLTGTASGTAANVFADPSLTIGIPNSTLTADASGNYDYYFNLGYCVTETISSPGGGITVIPNICSNGGGGGSGGCITSGVAGVLQASDSLGGCQAAYIEVNGTILTSPIAPNFVDTATVTVNNPSTNQVGFSVVPGTNLALSTNSTPNLDQASLNFTDTPTILFTNPSGGVESATCATATSSQIGCARPDNTTIAISGGVLTALPPTSSALIIQQEDTTLSGKFAAGVGQTLDFIRIYQRHQRARLIALGRPIRPLGE